MTASPRRCIALIVVLLAAAALFLVTPGHSSATAVAAPGTDDEGGTAALRKALDAANKGFVEAKNNLANSKKRQAILEDELAALEVRHGELLVEVGRSAALAYRTGNLSTTSLLLDSTSPDSFWERAELADTMARHDAKQLRRLLDSQQQLKRAKAAIELEIREQKKQVAVMAKRKDDAERALRATGAGANTVGFISANSPRARPAPRNPDGSWPREGCSINDPTTGGCISPRTLHALRQAQAAGFKRHVSCHRSGGGGEHPLGKACDFAAQRNGFGGTATGGDRTYGNNLAAFFVRNAGRLGVLYVIWFRKIWMPSTGWRTYNGGSSPSGAHTNHVHLSMQ